MPCPGFEPETFGAVAGFPSHYIAWSAKYDCENFFTNIPIDSLNVVLLKFLCLVLIDTGFERDLF